MIRDLFVCSHFFGSGDFPRVHMEYDCVNLVNAINYKSLVLTKLARFVYKVVELGKIVMMDSFGWSARSTNGVTHRLAHASLFEGD